MVVTMTLVLERTYGIDIESWYRNGIMVCIWTQGIEKINGIDLNSWKRIGTPKSHTYKRADTVVSRLIRAHLRTFLSVAFSITNTLL